MIDIHSHILYGLDDGARDFAESVAMLRQAAEAGTSDIVATPHASPAYPFQPALAAARIAELREAVQDCPRIHAGVEFHLTPENIEDAVAHPDRYSINGRGFLLVEFANAFVPPASGEILGRLRRAGLTPVIAHPERNPILREKLELLQAWIEAGALVQITALSLLGGFGRGAKAACRAMLRRGLAHFAASDAHDCGDRNPSLREARRLLEKDYSKACAALLLDDNPRLAISGGPDTPAPFRMRRTRLWF